MIRKGIALIVMLLLIGVNIIPSCGTTCKNSESLETHKVNEYQPCPDIKLDLYPTDDGYTSHHHPDENYGSSEDIRIANEYGINGSPGWADVAYVIFDLWDIRHFFNREITSAELNFYYHDYEGTNPEGRQLNLYNVKSNWNEDTLTWNNQPSYETDPISSATVPSSTGKWITWDVTSDIQRLIDNFEFYHDGYRISDDDYWGQPNIPTTIVKSKENERFCPYIVVTYEFCVPQQSCYLKSIGDFQFNNDTTPPVTTHSLNPPEPDGENGYYVNDVEVTLNATDNESGVDRIEYRIDGGSWVIIPGDNGTFVFGDDGNDVLIEYRAYDNAGNEEDIKSFSIDIDQTPPRAEEVAYEFYKEFGCWYLELTAHATDSTSCMDRVEFFIRNKHNETINGSGPDYVFTVKWTYKVYKKILYFHHYDRAGNLIIVEREIGNWSTPPPSPPPSRDLIGIICNREISEENVSFFAIVVFEPFTFEPLILEHTIFPNNYTGYIGRFFIRAYFYEWY